LVITVRPAFAEAVDLALVLAADVSNSVDQQEFEFQRQGYAAAINDARVLDAIQSGTHKAIAVCFLEWSGAPEQRVVVDWTIIRDREVAAEFAGKLLAAPRSFSGSTAIGAAIDFAARQLARSGIETARRAVDVSGDGDSNQGRPVTAARDDAVADGITINGLAITNERDNAPHTHPVGGSKRSIKRSAPSGAKCLIARLVDTDITMTTTGDAASTAKAISSPPASCSSPAAVSR
jgi:hypothetical protein